MKYIILTMFILFSLTSRAHMGRIVSAVDKASNKYNLNPNLIMAIIKVESTFKPMAVGSHGEVGLMQLRPRFHKGVTFDIENNIIMGSRYLLYIKNLKGDKKGWFVYYNRGPFSTIENPRKTLYYKKVRKALKEKYYDSKT